MKITRKHIVFVAILALLSAAFALLSGAARVSRSAKLCNALDVQIRESYEFVTPEDIKGMEVADLHFFKQEGGKTVRVEVKEGTDLTELLGIKEG